jgi:hypothetical protein
MLTQERVRYLFTYDEKNGLLLRNLKRGKGLPGKPSLCKDKDGYHVVGIDNKNYRTHRVIWLYVYGEFPEGYLDHINRIRTDNRIENLREADYSKNGYNTKTPKANTTGVKNVQWIKHMNKYQVRLRANNQNLVIGHFADLELAELVAIEARNKYHGTFANHGTGVA